MPRQAACMGIFATLVIGCAGTQSQTQVPEWQTRLDELRNSQNRLELRIEEVTRNLLVLRERVDAQEAALAALSDTEKAPEAPPPLRVVRLEPTRTEPVPLTAGGTAAADLYRRAFNAYREGRHAEAILDFEEFLQLYPDHEYADNAQYWIGESYYSQKEYEQAVVEFNRVLDRYAHEAKAPDALLKIGRSYEQLGDRERARIFWGRLVSQYPQSEAARSARKLLSAEQ